MRLTPFWAGLIPALFFCLALSACSTQQGLEQASKLAHSEQFNTQIYKCHQHAILGFSKKLTRKERTAHVYIEGDGLAWRSPSRPSQDPTPTNPMGLRLAVADQSGYDVIYLSRPCQYLKTAQCQTNDWTFGRYSRTIIQTYLELFNQLKSDYENFHLHGFSGGGTIALLIAAHRNDVLSVTTFAGLLDTETWTCAKGYTALRDSLNPLHFVDKLLHLPQKHYIGAKDKIIGPEVYASYSAFFQNQETSQFITIPNFGHESPWDTFWRKQL